MEIATNDYKKLLLQVQKLIKQTEQEVVQNVNRAKVLMSWQIGKEIDEHFKNNLKVSDTAYGKKLLERLAEDTAIKERVLYQMRAFYKTYPTLPKNENDLSWSHYRNLAAIKNDEKRKIFEELTVKNNLDSDQLQQAIAESKPRTKEARKLRVKKISDVKSAKLKVTRGQLFTYKLTALNDPSVERSRNHGKVPAALLKPNSRGFNEAQLRVGGRVFVDLGFNIFSEIKTSLQGEGIVESKKIGEKISLKKSTLKPTQLHTYKAYLERVVDGDTIHVILDLGFKTQHREILRLAKINAPEMATAAGKKASEALKKILKDVTVLVVKTNKTDIYGRYIADVFFDETGKEKDLQKIANEGTYLSQLLLDRGLVEVF